MGAAAVAVMAALALGGCGGGTGDHAAKDPTPSMAAVQPSPSPSEAEATASASATGRTPTPVPDTTPPVVGGADGSGVDGTDDGGASADSVRSVEGVWLATVDGAKVQLVLGKGKAALTSTHLCGGGYTGHDRITLKMTCMDGDKERTKGSGELAADGNTLTVQWTDGPTDTFTRTGLPAS